MKQQCLGITKSGEQCKLTGNFTDGYCHLHRPSAAKRSPEPAVESPRAKTPPPPQSTSDPVVEERGSSGPLIIAGIILLFVALAALVTGKRR